MADFRQLVMADVERNWDVSERQGVPRSWADVLRTLPDVRFAAVFLLRVAGRLAQGGRAGRAGSRVVSLANRMLFGVESAPQTQIGPGLYLPHTTGIVIGAAEIGAGCTIYHQVTLGATTIDIPFTSELRPRVGDGVVLASGCKVLGGVRVGDGAVVAANSVVVRDVEDRQRVGGVPARPLRGDE